MTSKERDDEQLAFGLELDAPPEKVWRALTVKAFVERWLEPEAGMAAEVIVAEPPRQLSWRWQEAGEPDGVVTFTLTPTESGGTVVRLVHVRSVHVVAPAANRNDITMMLAA